MQTYYDNPFFLSEQQRASVDSLKKEYMFKNMSGEFIRTAKKEIPEIKTRINKRKEQFYTSRFRQLPKELFGNALPISTCFSKSTRRVFNNLFRQFDADDITSKYNLNDYDDCVKAMEEIQALENQIKELEKPEFVLLSQYLEIANQVPPIVQKIETEYVTEDKSLRPYREAPKRIIHNESVYSPFIKYYNLCSEILMESNDIELLIATTKDFIEVANRMLEFRQEEPRDLMKLLKKVKTTEQRAEILLQYVKNM